MLPNQNADFTGAKTKQPISCLGKPLPPAKYSTFGGQRPGILLTPRVEQVTFVFARTPRSFIAKRWSYQLGHTYIFAERGSIWQHYMALVSER
jgi:hypothetical protein